MILGEIQNVIYYAAWKTEWNALHKIQGRTDIPLNEEGRLMAEKHAKSIRICT